MSASAPINFPALLVNVTVTSALIGAPPSSTICPDSVTVERPSAGMRDTEEGTISTRTIAAFVVELVTGAPLDGVGVEAGSCGDAGGEIGETSRGLGVCSRCVGSGTWAV